MVKLKLKSNMRSNVVVEQEYEQALAGIRVLELADEMGMYCGKLLADMGAEVIKIEKPGGDPTRNYLPFAYGVPDPNKSLYFWFYNANKKAITLNLESKTGKELFRNLVKTADVVIETFPPGYLDDLELGYQELHRVQPRLILTSITPFGQTGPRKDFRASDLVVSALGGLVYVNGEPDDRPVKFGGEQAYHMASHFAAIGTLCALLNRDVTGEGQHVDVSAQECVASAIEHVNIYYIYNKNIPTRQSTYHWSFGFYICECKDGYALLTHWGPWAELIAWLEEEGAAGDLTEERWQLADARREPDLDGSSHVFGILESWAKKHTVAEIVEKGQRIGLAWSPVKNLAELLNDPHYIARNWFVNVEHPEIGRNFKYPGSPFKFHETPWRIRRRAPLIGEDNEEIYLGELGLCRKELLSLKSEGII